MRLLTTAALSLLLLSWLYSVIEASSTAHGTIIAATVPTMAVPTVLALATTDVTTAI